MNIYGKSNSCNNNLETLHKKKKFSIKDFFYKCDQIHSFLRIWSHLQKNGKFIFCAVEPCYDAYYNKKTLFHDISWTSRRIWHNFSSLNIKENFSLSN